MASVEAAQELPVHYSFKPSPYGSHTLTIDALPADGAGRTVLDLGCANGHIAAILASRGYRVTGVERPEGVDAGFPSSVELVHADLDRGLPPLGRRYHHILCADILEHLKDPSKLLRQLPQVLEPAGTVVASLPNSGNIYFRLNILLGRFPRHDRGLFDRTHLHFYMWDGWLELFESCGFRIDAVRPTGIPVGLGLPNLAGTWAVRAAERLCYDLARTWKRMFAYQFVVTAHPADSGRKG